MNLAQRIGTALGVIEQRAEGSTPAGVMPPARSSADVTTETALSISMVYRAIQIHYTAAMQLAIEVDRRDATIPTPSVIRQPDQSMSRSAWIAKNVVSLATTGNAFWRINRDRSTGRIIDLVVLNPHEVTILEDLKTGRVAYAHKGTIYNASQIHHLALMRIPGRSYGLGPIQAARAEISGVLDTREYAAGWFHSSGVPSGVLSSDQVLNKEQADRYKTTWMSAPAGEVRVLGQGLSYEPVMLNPADAQWLENQQFNVTQMARLLGAPASLMLATVEGNTQTYQNVEQDWIGYVRFSLMNYLREMEEGLSLVLPRGQQARFTVETLLRTDTLTRYQAHQIALDAGFLTLDEVRRIEHREPLPPTAAAPDPEEGQPA